MADDQQYTKQDAPGNVLIDTRFAKVGIGNNCNEVENEIAPLQKIDQAGQ